MFIFILPAILKFSPLQGSASTLLAFLEREKELLRIFLKVSQMENTILRRMNLSSFLMVSHTILRRMNLSSFLVVSHTLLRKMNLSSFIMAT